MTPKTVLPLLAAATFLTGILPAATDCCFVESFIEETVAPKNNKASVILPANASSVVLDWPIASFSLNSPFGPRQLGSQNARYDWHRGTDLRVPIGTDVVAPADAFVVFSGISPNFADPVIQLRHNSSEPYLYTLYLHMSETLAVAGDTIPAGTLIGRSGQGTATYPHLHWEVRRGCLRQECCENVYSYMNLPTSIPAVPVVYAAGDSPLYGRMLLLDYSFPKTELDFQGVEITWGAKTISADLNTLNALSPTGQGAKLDDPLFFAENHNAEFVFLPKRFNDTFASVDYQFLAWGLPSVNSGDIKVFDSQGQEGATTANINLPPVTVVASPETVVYQPGSPFEIVYTITNNDTVSRTINLEAISAQSLTLTRSASTVNLASGASTNVTVSGTLSGSFPEGVGDAVLLVSSVQGGGWTPLLNATAIDTDASARIVGWQSLAD